MASVASPRFICKTVLTRKIPIRRSSTVPMARPLALASQPSSQMVLK